MAKASKTSKVSTANSNEPIIDLSHAEVATGEIKDFSSVYEILGRRTNPYKVNTFEEYKAKIGRMNLIDLQEHAYELGEAPIASRERLIDRLERKYLEAEGKKKTAIGLAHDNTNKPASNDLNENVAKILKRGKSSLI